LKDYEAQKRALGESPDEASQSPVLLSTGQRTESSYQQERRLRALRELDEKIADLSWRLATAETFFIAFFAAPDISLNKFIEKASKKIEPYGRYKLIYSQDQKLQFGEVCVDHHESLE
jgi:hypothetical protein